jgi:hypothetical protein
LPRMEARKGWIGLSLLIGVTILGPALPSLAQIHGFGRDGGRYGGSGAQDRQSYNPQTVTTVKGLVESLGSYGMTGWRVAPGMQTPGLVLKTDKGKIPVNLGPPWYVSKQGFTFKPGDTLEVTGSQVTRDDKTVLLAAQVNKDEQTLKVRDEKGEPCWHREGSERPGAGGMGHRGKGSGGRGAGGRGLISW